MGRGRVPVRVVRVVWLATEYCSRRQRETRFPPPGVGVQVSGGYSVGETPGPIPNPVAKTHSADGTALGRVWESKSPPEST